jgi:hypothetical protein
MFPYANTCKNTPVEIYFIYLGNKEIYCIFKTSCIMSVLFSTKCHLFLQFYLYVFNIMHFFLNHALNFKY